MHPIRNTLPLHEELRKQPPQLLQAPDSQTRRLLHRFRHPFLKLMHNSPPPQLGMPAIQRRIIHKVAIPRPPQRTRLPLRLLEHLRMRFRQQGHLPVIAEGDPFEELLHAQNPHHPPRVRDVRVREQPQLHLPPVHAPQQLPQPFVPAQHLVQRQRVVHFAVVGHRVDLVVLDQPRDGEAVVGVVFAVQQHGVVRGQGEVPDKVSVDEFLHQILHAGGAGVEAVVYVEEEDGTGVPWG